MTNEKKRCRHPIVYMFNGADYLIREKTGIKKIHIVEWCCKCGAVRGGRRRKWEYPEATDGR